MRSHRSPRLTLLEILDSTEAVGYWFQLKSDEAAAPNVPQYIVATDFDRRHWGHLELKLIGRDQVDEFAGGNAYVSEWVQAGNHKRRILAVGPAPIAGVSWS